MADNREILLKFGVDGKKLDENLTNAITASVRKAFTAIRKNPPKLNVDLNTSGLSTQLKKFFNQLNSNQIPGLKRGVQIDVTLNLKNAAAQIKAFQQGLKPLQLPVNATQAPAAPTGPPKPNLNPASILINQAEIDKSATALRNLQNELKNVGLREVEVNKQTGALHTSLKNIQNEFNKINRERTALNTAQGLPGMAPLSDAQILRLNKAQLALADLNKEMGNFSQRSAIMRTDADRTGKFMESFGFKIGILGFSMNIFGGQLSRFSQFMAQFVQESAKATEPLERMTNLVTQLIEEGTIDPNQKGFILAELNRLADLPGSNLDSVVKSFRQLNNLGLELRDTFALIEGLTKATARSGVGAQGLDRLTEQLRQFATSGTITERDIRTISEQGGKTLTDVLTAAFGSTDAQTLEAAGPQKVIQAIIAGLSRMAPPLETTSDRLNKINNAFIRMRAHINEIIAPGLDNLLGGMNRLEKTVDSLAKRFNQLPEGMQSFFGNLIVIIPVVTAALAGVLAVLGTLAIGIAGGRQLLEGYRTAMTFLAKATGQTSTEISLLATASAKLKTTFAPLITMFKAITSSALTWGSAMGIVAFELKGILGFIPRILGLVSPIGIILNLVLAIITNAGHARDVVGGALGELFTQFRRLFSILSGFFIGPAGAAILNFINSIVNLLGGTLGNLLAGVILNIANLIELLNDLFGLIQNPSVNNLNKLFGSFFNAITFSATKVGALMAASFLEFLADNLEGGLKLPTLVGTVQLPTGGLSQGLRDRAANIRNNVFGTDSFGQQGNQTAKNLEQSRVEAEKMNTALKESNKIISDMQESTNKLAIQFAKNVADLRINQIRFLNDMANSRARTELERLIKRDVNAAEQQAPGILAGIRQRSVRAVGQEANLAAGPFINDINRAMGQLQERSIALQDFLGTGFNEVLNGYKTAVAELNALGSKGGTLNQFNAAFENVRKSGEALGKIFTGTVLGDKEKKQAEELKDAYKEVQDTVGKFQQETLNRAGTIQKLRQEEIEANNTIKEQIEEQRKALAAQARVLPLQHQLDRYNEFLIAQQDLLNDESLTIAEIEKINGNILKIKQNIVDKETEIAKASLTDKDELREKEILNNRILKGTQNQNEVLREQRRILQDIGKAAQETVTNVRKGIAELLGTLRGSRLTSRGAVEGLAPGDFLFGLDSRISELNATRNTNVTGRIRGDISDLGRGLGRTELQSLRIPEQLRSALASLHSFDENFEFVVENLTKQLDTVAGEIQIRIRGLDIAVSNINRQLQDGTLSPERRKELEAQLEGLNRRRAEEQKSADGLAKTEAVINDLLKERNTQIEQELEKRNRVNNRVLAQLNAQRELLQIEQDLINEQIRNTQLRQEAPGGFGATLDLAGQDAQHTQALEKQRELINNSFDIQLRELQIRRTNLELQLRMNGATEEHIKLVTGAIDAQIKGVENLRDIQLKNLDLDATNTSLQRFINLLQNLGSVAENNVIRNFAASIKAAADGIKNNFNLISSSAQLFKDVATAAVTSAAQAIGQALVDMIVNGENFLESFTKFLGQMLINLGTALIQMSLAAVAWAFMDGLFKGGLPLAIGQAAAVAPMAAVGVAVGTGLVIAGAAMGGGGEKAASTSNTNTGNTTGAKPDDNWNPEQDPRTIYSKAMMAQIEIDVRVDDGLIVKKVIKAVNSNGRLANLIGNRKLEFQY